MADAMLSVWKMGGLIMIMWLGSFKPLGRGVVWGRERTTQRSFWLEGEDSTGDHEARGLGYTPSRRRILKHGLITFMGRLHHPIRYLAEHEQAVIFRSLVTWQLNRQYSQVRLSDKLFIQFLTHL